MRFFTRKEVTAILLFGAAMGVIGIGDGRDWMRFAGGTELVLVTVYALMLIWWPAKWPDE